MSTTTSLIISFIAIALQIESTFSKFSICKSSPFVKRDNVCETIIDPQKCVANTDCIWDSQGTLTNLVGKGDDKLYKKFELGSIFNFDSVVEKHSFKISEFDIDNKIDAIVSEWNDQQYLENIKVHQVDSYGVEYKLTPNSAYKPSYGVSERRRLPADIAADAAGRAGTGQYPFTATGSLYFQFCLRAEPGRPGYYNVHSAHGHCVGSVINRHNEWGLVYDAGLGRMRAEMVTYVDILTAGHCCFVLNREIHDSCAAATGFYTYNFDFYQGIDNAWNDEGKHRGRGTERHKAGRTAFMDEFRGALYVPKYEHHETFGNDWCVIKLYEPEPPAVRNQRHLKIKFDDDWRGSHKFIQPTYDFSVNHRQRVIYGNGLIPKGNGNWIRNYRADSNFKVGMSGSPICFNAGDDALNPGDQWQVQVGIAVGRRFDAGRRVGGRLVGWRIVGGIRVGGIEQDYYSRISRSKFRLIVAHTGQGPIIARGATTAITASKLMAMNLYNDNNQQFYNEYKRKQREQNDKNKDLYSTGNDGYYMKYGEGFRSKIGYKNKYNYHDKYTNHPMTDKRIERMEIRDLMKRLNI